MKFSCGSDQWYLLLSTSVDSILLPCCSAGSKCIESVRCMLSCFFFKNYLVVYDADIICIFSRDVIVIRPCRPFVCMQFFRTVAHSCTRNCVQELKLQTSMLLTAVEVGSWKYVLLYYKAGGRMRRPNLALVFWCSFCMLPTVLWCCWLGVRKSIRPVKKWGDEVQQWLSVWSEVKMICTWSTWCHCHPIISYFIEIQNSFTFLVPVYPGCPGKETIKQVSILWFWYFTTSCLEYQSCKNTKATLFSAYVYCGHGRPSQLLRSSCTNGRPKMNWMFVYRV